MLGKILFNTYQLFGTDEPPASDSLRESLTYRAWTWLSKHLPETCSLRLFKQLEAVDWDGLIIPSMCRYDTLSEMVTDAVVGHDRSPASATWEFIQAVQSAGFEDTTYVCANPDSDLGSPSPNCEHVSVHASGWNDPLVTVPGVVFEPDTPVGAADYVSDRLAALGYAEE
ncbi:hypothetical protein [Haloarcula sp. CBA1127]|uniref:hypothetical protein n=1 Tax=Haloarcula sp. CBA1127 TaxID=1765055 RepID=UPI00073F0D3D|nr:hypothetical protein [Haloarcula sp. CBA1127]